MKNKGTAALICFFLGGIGGHKFYLGETGKGLLYLLFCWTFIPAMVAFVEFFLLLFMDEQKFNQKYNQQAALPDGGSQMGQNVTINMEGGQDSGPSKSTAEELEKLQELRTSGALSEEEFEQQKQKLLSDS